MRKKCPPNKWRRKRKQKHLSGRSCFTVSHSKRTRVSMLRKQQSIARKHPKTICWSHHDAISTRGFGFGLDAGRTKHDRDSDWKCDRGIQNSRNHLHFCHDRHMGTVGSKTGKHLEEKIQLHRSPLTGISWNPRHFVLSAPRIIAAACLTTAFRKCFANGSHRDHFISVSLV